MNRHPDVNICLFFTGVYNDQNLALSSTHTHSGAGGYMQYFLFLATSLGFVEDSYVAARNGIVEAISMAHNNMQGSPHHRLFWKTVNENWQRCDL